MLIFSNVNSKLTQKSESAIILTWTHNIQFCQKSHIFNINGQKCLKIDFYRVLRIKLLIKVNLHEKIFY
jgi:hypothetical protein